VSAIGLMTRRAERVMLAGVIDSRLRPVEAGDSAALFDLHRATMRTYLSRIELSPELQNLGLGAAIIEGLID
jgi:hypothetical protein